MERDKKYIMIISDDRSLINSTTNIVLGKEVLQSSNKKPLLQVVQSDTSIVVIISSRSLEDISEVINDINITNLLIIMPMHTQRFLILDLIMYRTLRRMIPGVKLLVLASSESLEESVLWLNHTLLCIMSEEEKEFCTKWGLKNLIINSYCTTSTKDINRIRSFILSPMQDSTSSLVNKETNLTKTSSKSIVSADATNSLSDEDASVFNVTRSVSNKDISDRKTIISSKDLNELNVSLINRSNLYKNTAEFAKNRSMSSISLTDGSVCIRPILTRRSVRIKHKKTGNFIGMKDKYACLSERGSLFYITTCYFSNNAPVLYKNDILDSDDFSITIHSCLTDDVLYETRRGYVALTSSKNCEEEMYWTISVPRTTILSKRVSSTVPMSNSDNKEERDFLLDGDEVELYNKKWNNTSMNASGEWLECSSKADIWIVVLNKDI